VVSKNDELVHHERENGFRVCGSVFSEKQFIDAVQNFFASNRRGEKAVTGEYSAGNHLAFGTKTAQRQDWCVFQREVAIDLAFDFELSLTGGGDQDQIGLKPAGGVDRELIVVFLAD